MPTQKLIAVKEFCTHHHISSELIYELYRNEMIELVMIKRTGFIDQNTLPVLEKIIRLHHELEINIEGIQTILHLLSHLQQQESELRMLRNRLAFFTEE